MHKKRAILVTFTVKGTKFESVYERNKFFKSLYGWKQIIRKELTSKKHRTEEKVYAYRRYGLLDEIPHFKVDQSSFIVPEGEFEKIEKFLDEWHDKVMFRCFKILLEDEDILRAFENFKEWKQRELKEKEW